MRDAGELVHAINRGAGEIEVNGAIELERFSAESLNALPVITHRTLTLRGADGAELRAASTGYRLLEALDGGVLTLSGIRVSGFSTSDPGGALRIEGGRVELRGVVFENNHSDNDGGALHVQGSPFAVEIWDSVFEDNTAGDRGGAVSLFDTDALVDFNRNRFVDNRATRGCDVSLERSEGTAFTNNVFGGPCDGALVDAARGRQGFRFRNNTWVAQGGWAFRYRVLTNDNPKASMLSGNVLVQTEPGGFDLCRQVGDVGEGAGVRSLGHNVATDESCNLDQETDVLAANASAVLASPPDPTPLAPGPAVDVVDLPVTSVQFPMSVCTVGDARGLGRPQDGDGDGISKCDLGAIEVQAGPAIGAAQSGAYFDPARPGEGYFVEVLDGGRAWVTFFTHVGNHPGWFFGLGQVVGNSIFVPQLMGNGGGRFGDAFNPNDISQGETGPLSLVFPGCEASVEQPGGAFVREEPFFNVPTRLALHTRLVRLSGIVECGRQTQRFPSGLSGNFYDPNRPGEGIGVQWLPDGRVVVVWYTFDLEGRHLWMISDGAEVDGNTVAAPMIYPASATHIWDFDPDEIDLQPWGTLTLRYTDCDHIELSYDSQVEGYGSGSLDYVRLTQPAGTECEPF